MAKGDRHHPKSVRITFWASREFYRDKSRQHSSALRRLAEEAELYKRELHALYANAVLCKDPAALVEVLVHRAEAAGLTKDGETLTDTGVQARSLYHHAGVGSD